MTKEQTDKLLQDFQTSIGKTFYIRIQEEDGTIKLGFSDIVVSIDVEHLCITGNIVEDAPIIWCQLKQQQPPQLAQKKRLRYKEQTLF